VESEIADLRFTGRPSRGWKRLITAAVTLALAVPASAAATSGDSTAPTANWAGYVLVGQGTTFTSVTATWKQPAARCTARDVGTAVAFWVGLGGTKPGSGGLEQAGTSAHCTASGAAYGAWYQVVPSHAVELDLAVRPTDVITASVNVLDGGTALLFQLKNRTLRKTVTTQVPLTDQPDLSSEDWVVEAPTRCAGALCLPVPLQQFAPMSFSRIAALGNGSGGTLTRSDWSASSLQLVPSTVLVPRSSALAPTAVAAGALPASLTPGGTSFRVYWLPNALNTGV
jgi:hypothetical protein